ncbi:hypothetical protein P9112_012295 [Eukaryota sp. TZLM1-RC]
MSVIICGSLNTDLSFYASHFPTPGETLQAKSFTQGFGGKGANQAIACAKCGVETHLISALGDDIFGKAYSQHLSSFSCLKHHNNVIAGCSSGLASITIDESGENQIILNPGANLELGDQMVDHFFDSYGNSLLKANKLIGLVQGELSLSTTLHFLRECKKLNIFTVFNFAPVSVTCQVKLLPELVDLLIVNTIEASSLVEQFDLYTTVEPIKLMETLCRYFKSVVITLGKEGAIIGYGDQTPIVSIPATTVEKVVDTTGAGDACCGSLCAALALGFPLEQSLKAAMRVAGDKVGKAGAQSTLTFSESSFVEFVNNC